MNYNEDIRRRILSHLKVTEFGLSITDVSVLVPTTRITAKKHLERLVRENLARETKKGNLRIFNGVSND